MLMMTTVLQTTVVFGVNLQCHQVEMVATIMFVFTTARQLNDHCWRVSVDALSTFHSHLPALLCWALSMKLAASLYMISRKQRREKWGIFVHCSDITNTRTDITPF